MPIVSELIVNGTLVPSVSGQPTHSDAYGEGGFRVVSTLTDRNAIPTDFKKAGMVVHVTANGKSYSWTGSTWDENGFIDDASLVTAKYVDLSITTSKIGDSQVTTAKLASGAVDASKMADGAAISFDDTIIFGALAAAPLTSTTIDLSGYVGTTSQCQVCLEVYCDNIAGTNYYFGDNSGNKYISGISSASLATSGYALVSVMTDSNCRIDWLADNAYNTTLKLRSYIR